MNVFEPHSLKQQELIFSESETTIGATGTQWGKTQAGALWMQRQIFTYCGVKDNFIVAAPTYKILQQSVIPYFMFHMKDFGTPKWSDSEFKVNGGGTVYFRTETDPDSIVGIPNVRAGWLDEAGKLRLYFWENYRARAAAKGAKTLLTTSPYSLNWIYKDYIKPKLAGKLPDVTLIQAASWENPHHTLHDPVKRQKEQDQMDPRRFNMIFGGAWERMIGLVYDCFDETQHVIKPFELPSGTKYYAGVDWGYEPDPFALVVRAITPSGHHFQVSEIVKTRMTLPDIIIAAKQKKHIYNIECFYADPSQPGHIEEFNRNGLPCIKADNTIRLGIDFHYELIKSGRYKIFEGSSPHTLDELTSYHYPEPEELKPDQDSKEENPVGQHDHALDANRYCTIMTYRSGDRKAPTAPEEKLDPKTMSHEKRIEHLKKKNRLSRGSESWS